MPTYLSKSQIAAELAERGLGQKVHITNILTALGELAKEEVEAGSDFVVPGVVKLSYGYTKPYAKGDKWKKGDTVTGIGGIESVKDSDSPAVKAKVTFRVTPLAAIKAVTPSRKTAAAFAKTKVGKAVIRRKVG